MKNITFITHEASLTGAPILLLPMIKSLSLQNHCNVKVIIHRDGPLKKEFEKVATCIVLKPEGYSNTKGLGRLKTIIVSKLNLIHAIFIIFKSNFVINNTIVNGKLIRIFSFFNSKIVTYVHELEDVLKKLELLTKLSIKNSKLLLSPSNAVTNCLISKFGVSETKIVQLPYLFEKPRKEYSEFRKGERKIILKNYNLSEETVLFFMIGTVSTRKGYETFINIATEVNKKSNFNSAFFWIGGFDNKEIETQIADRNNTLIENNIFFLGKKQNTFINYLPFDILFLSSKEDPYPLVVIEAALMGLPTICFADSGGATEFVKNDAGWSIIEKNQQIISNFFLEICKEKKMIISKGELAKRRASELHLDNKNFLKKIETIYSALDI